ncbi:hypothetical protein Lfu02_13560 [Longispora fulva]|nr:hypothetical protein Lfu02_13560 [Longispora fulva]
MEVLTTTLRPASLMLRKLYGAAGGAASAGPAVSSMPALTPAMTVIVRKVRKTFPVINRMADPQQVNRAATIGQPTAR